MKQGDKIQTIYGQTETVMKVEDRRIFTYENQNGWYHPTKVFPVNSNNIEAQESRAT